MAVTAWKTAGTCANDSSAGSLAWVADFDLGDPLVGNELSSDDGNDANTGYGSGATSNFLKATNFGFTTSDIPTGSSIDGFEVEVRQYRGTTATVVSTLIKLVKSGSIVGNDFGTTADWATAETAVIYGNATQLGGQSWNVSDVTASNFGMVLAYTSSTSRFFPFGNWAFVDQVRIRVYYTVGGGGSFDPKVASQFLTFFF